MINTIPQEQQLSKKERKHQAAKLSSLIYNINQLNYKLIIYSFEYSNLGQSKVSNFVYDRTLKELANIIEKEEIIPEHSIFEFKGSPSNRKYKLALEKIDHPEKVTSLKKGVSDLSGELSYLKTMRIQTPKSQVELNISFKEYLGYKIIGWTPEQFNKLSSLFSKK